MLHSQCSDLLLRLMCEVVLHVGQPPMLAVGKQFCITFYSIGQVSVG